MTEVHLYPSVFDAAWRLWMASYTSECTYPYSRNIYPYEVYQVYEAICGGDAATNASMIGL